MASYDSAYSAVTLLAPNTIISEMDVADLRLGPANASLTSNGAILQELVIQVSSLPLSLAQLSGTMSTTGLLLSGGEIKLARAVLSMEVTGTLDVELFGTAKANVNGQMLGVVDADVPFTLVPEYRPEYKVPPSEEIFPSPDGDFWEDYVVNRVATESLAMTSQLRATARLWNPEKTLLLQDVALNIYSLWGYDGITQASQISLGRERIVQYCNAAMQQIYSQADRLDYFNRLPTEFTVDNTGIVILPQNVQRLLGPVKIGTRPLQALSSAVEANNFASWYMDGSAAGDPIAYYAESQRQERSDSILLTVRVIPSPATAVQVTIDLTMEPPRYDALDVLGGKTIELPHHWVESLLLPIVRKLAVGDNLMNKAKLASVSAEVNSQYEAARQMLGLADSAPPPVQRHREEAIPA